MAEISLPYKYEPRPYQLPALAALDDGIRRVVAVWHRRSGKDVTFLSYVAKAMYQRRGSYFYLFPTYSQAKKVIWDGKQKDGMPFLDHFPPELISKKNEAELKIEYTNGSDFRLVGTDNIDRILGTNPVGCVFSEYALQDPIAWDLIRPILRENGGWAVFDFTPRGKNHGWELFEMAKNNKDWFTSRLTIDDTHVLSERDIDAERREGMDEELIQQEYYCSFEGSRVGSYYSQQLRIAESDGRITSVPYEPIVGVETWWDLGIGDAMAIWFTQSVGREVRVIDYHEASGEGFAHYAKVLSEKPYTYMLKNAHHAPFDIEVRELGTGRSRQETAAGLGIAFVVVPRLGVDDGIEAVRSFLSRCWFDRARCERGLKALWSYHKEFDEKRKTYRSTPEHDWSSHAADAFRYLAVGHKSVSLVVKPEIEITRYTQREEAGVDWLAS